MAKRAPKAPDIIDVVPENPELQLATTEGSSVSSFVAGMKQFFTRAGELETRAKETLSVAKTWKQPKTKEDDEQLVAAVRRVNGEKREVEEHWTITTIVSRFHKRLTAARDRAVEPLEEAARIGNRLHADYDEQERRRAREQAEADRREKERLAQEQRDRELAQLEQQALDAEAGSPDLSDREARFVDYYAGPYAASAARAAQQAGYKNPDQAAAKLLATPKIQQALEAKRTAIAARDQAAAKKAAPVQVQTVEVKPEVAKGGSYTWSAELLDEEALIVALLDPMTRTKLGIPTDVLTVKPAKLNEYARALHENIDRWPGVRHKKTPSIR